MSRDPKLYLADIVEACRKIERIASGRDDDQLMSDEIVRDALLYSIVVIGEAAGRIPPDLQAAFPTIAWARIRAMRNILAHEYFGVDRGLVLDAVRNKVPELRRTLEAALGSA
ncbi:MAG TPA: DUF86 domain-containing protein [Anaeromyxobacteraceae bacterium]|nr:DUF86 domain-containing protein [Anaeromyxobacteraceae bacterium]